MTAQIGERLHYDGQEMSMCTHPLGDYFALGGINPGFGQEWPLDCTSLWRGYIGTWEVLGDRLYLVAIHKLALNGPGTNFLETVFPGYPDRVFAQPSMEAVELAARMMAAKVHRELNAQQSQEQKQPEPKRQGGLKISPSTFNQGVTDNWRAESLDWGLD